MQFQRKGKKDNNQENASRIDDVNVSVHSGLNVDSYRRGRETTGRQMNYPIRGEELDKSTTESGYRETLFLDRDDVLRRHQNMSPITEGRQTVGLYVPMNRSPQGQYGRQSVISSVRQDLNERQDTAQIVGKKPIPTLTVQIPFRKEDTEQGGERRVEGSPKVISLAGGDEYGTRSLNFRRSPEQPRMTFQYGVNTINPDYTGNLLIDQPVNVLGSFIQSGDNFYTQAKALPKSGSNQQLIRDPREREREIHFQPDRNVNNSREIYEGERPSQGIKAKMSPNRNLDQEAMYLDKHADFEDPRKMEKLKDLKRISNIAGRGDLDNTDNNEHMQKIGSNSYERPYGEVDNLYKNYAPDIENLMKMKQMRDSENYKKFNRQFTKGFEPQKKEGRLISERQTIVNPVNDQLFPDRRQVMQKMNKLSHILLSKSRSVDPLNRSMGNIDEDLNSSTINRNTLRERPLNNSNPPETGRKTYALNRSPQQKFIRVTMAMLSSKGPNCEDRIITRVMRYEKGGVVDLAQSTQSNKKYEVRKVRRKGEKSQNTVRRYNIKDRERASKIVQGWWREILNKYKNLVDKIKRIQKVWRGHWLRKYLYYIIYMTIIMQTFLDRLKTPSVRSLKREAMDRLLPFAVKFRARKNLSAIIKIQRQAREFLNRMKDSRTRAPLLIHKVFERRKVDTMNTLKSHAKKADPKKRRDNNADSLLKKTKKCMRVRIFHDLLFKVFNRPVAQLKSSLFHHLLKTNFKKFGHILLREYFMRWMKRSLRTPDDSAEGKTVRQKRAANQLYRSIVRPPFNATVDALKGLKNKEIRNKILKRCVKNANRYKDIVLKDYFRRWADVPRKMLAKDFKNQLSGNLLLKTARLSEARNLHKRFRDWRDNKIPAKNLVPFVNGTDKLKSFVRKRVHDKVMPITAVDGVKSRLLKSMMRKSANFTKIPLRHYYNKWKNFVTKARNIELSAKLIKSMGGKAFKNSKNRILLGRLLDWKRKANIERILEAEHKVPVIVEVPKEIDNHKKYFATVKLVNGTEKLAKRAALKSAMPNIKRYLDNQTLQRGMKKLVLMNPKLNRITLKNAWNKYGDQVKKLRQREMRDKLFDKLLNKSGSKFKDNLLRKYLRKWFRNLPKGVEIKYFNGSDMLQKALWRRNIRKPIDAFKEKVDVDNAKNGVIKALGLKNKYINRHWREYLLKWKKISDKLKLKQIKNDLMGKLMGTLFNKMRNRILSNKFSHWRKVPKINMKDIFDRYKGMNDVVKRTVNHCLKPHKQEFLKSTRAHKGNKAYKTALNRLANLAINGKNIKLKSAWDRWRTQCKNIEIHDLKIKLLRYSVGQEGIKNRKKSLASAFNKWLRNAKMENLLRHGDKNLIIYKAVHGLEQLVNRRRNDFMTRLKRLMNLDSRGRVLFNIYKRLQRPRNSMSRCFDRWRRHNDHYNKNVLTKNYITKLLDKSCAKVSKRQVRDNFVKCFNKWKNLLKKPEDYYLRIADATHKTDKFLKSKACPPAFNQLADHKNYKKYFMKILPSTTRLRQRMERDSLLRCWNKWKKDVADGRAAHYKGTILDKLTTKMGQRRRNNRLAAAFHKWGNIKPKSLHFPDVVKASDITLNTLQRRYRRPIFDNLQKNHAAKTKRNGLMLLFGKSKTFNDFKLRNYFRKWWKNTLLNVDGIKSRVMRNVKRFVVENHMMNPMEKYFRRWLRNMIEKPKNINDYVQGADKLKSAMKKNLAKAPLKTLKTWRSPDALKRALFNKVLPNSKKLMSRYMGNALHQWKKNVDRQKLAEMQAKLLNTVYNKGKNALQKRYLKRYLNRWADKEENAPIDLTRIIGGEKKIFNMFTNKYLKDGFMPNLKDYSTKRFLRGLLNKNSKFHQRALEPFFKRWRDTANKLKDKQTKADLVGRLIAKTRNYFANKDIKDLIRKKFYQWRDNIKNYDKLVSDIVPKANELIKKNTLKKMFPELIKPLQAKKLKSQRKQKLLEADEIGFKVLTNHLRNALRRWKDQCHKLQMRDLRGKTMENHLKLFSKRWLSNRLARSFTFWKGAMLGKSNIRSILIGGNTLKKLFVRKPFHDLKDKTKMMNLKIPYGMPLSSVLIRHNPHVAKSVAIRNISMRPSFNKWRKNCAALKNQEIKEDTFKRLFYPHMRNKGKIVLRKAFNRWRDQMAEEDKKNLQRNFHSKVLFGIYDKNHELCLRHFFGRWKNETEANLRRLNNISLGVVKLRHQMGRKVFHDLYRKLYVNNDVVPRFTMVKKIMLNALRNNDKGNLLYCFSRWRAQNHTLREKVLKHKILANLVRADNSRIDNYDNNKLHECLLRWRINASPKDYYDTINRIRVGTHTLHKGLTKKFNKPIFDNIQDKARRNKINNLLYSFISDFDKKADQHILRDRFKHWRARVGDTDVEVKRLKRLANNYHKDSDVAHNELIKKPLTDLIDCMKAWVAFKTDKAASIQDYCKNLLLIFKRMKLVQRNRNIHKLFTNLNLKMAVKVRLLFARWMKNANLINADGKARLIQNFLRGKRDALTLKRNRVRDGMEPMERFVKRKTFNDLWLNGRNNRKRQLLLRLMKDTPDEVKQEFLKKYFKRWWGVILADREHAAGTMIIATLKGFLTRKFKNLLLKRRAKMNEVVKKLFLKYLDKRRLYFNKWMLDNRMNQIENASKVINGFLKGRLLNLKAARANIRLLELFRKGFIRKVKKGMEQASKINGDRGLIMYETLKNIFIERPFEKVRDGSKWIGRLRKLHHVWPRITRSLKNHWLPHYMRKWKEKTYDDMVNKIIRLQNWFRARLLLWRARVQAKKIGLVQKYITKLTKDTDLIQKLAMKNWAKKAKIGNLHQKASAVQAIWRGNTSRKNVDRMLNVKKMENFFRKAMLRRLCDGVTKCSDFIEPIKKNLANMNSSIEKRYPTNNLLDLANNAIRNAYMYKLTNKRAYLGQLSSLREYFNRWQRFAGLAEDAAKKLQSKYRQFRAKKQLNNLLRHKDLMLKIYGRYDDTEQGKLKVAFRRWNNRANQIKLNSSSKVIQDYIKKKNASWQATKLKNFFGDRALKLAKRRVNNAAKTDKLKTELQKHGLRTFLKRLENKNKQDKFRWLFARKFSHMDDKLKNMYLKKYMDDWNDKAKRIRNKQYAAALALTRMFRGNMARKFVAKLLRKKERMTYLMMRLIDDNDTKKRMFLRMWYNRMRADKLDESAKVLQNFMGDVKEKNNRIKSQRKMNRLNQGLENLDNTWKKAAPANAIHKVKSQANRNLLKKVGDDVENKKTDHLKTALKNIQDFGDLKHGVRNDKARFIQKKFNLFKNRKSIWNLIEKVRKMRFLLRMMADRNLRMLNKSFRLWRRNALGDKWHSSAATIQDFLSNRVLRWRKGQKVWAMENLYKMFRNHLVNKQFRPYMKDFVNTVKINKFNDHMGRHIFNKFKYNVFNYEKLNYLNKVFRLPVKISKKLLSKWFNKWRNTAEMLKKIEGVKKIQKNFRGFKEAKKLRLISDKMEKIMMKLAFKNDDKRKYYYTLWKRNARHMKMEESAKVIQNFVGGNYNRIKTKKKWWNLTNQMFIKHNILSGLNFWRRYKQWRSLRSIFGVIDHKIKRDGFDDLRDNSKNRKAVQLMKSVFGNFEKRNDTLALWKYWRRWNHQVGKLHERDRALENLNKIYDTRHKIIATKAVNDASLLKKTVTWVDRIRAKDALKNIKWRAANKDKLKRFGENLNKADDDLNNKNINLFANKLYRLYIYKILDNLAKGCNNFQQKVIKPSAANYFMHKLHNNYVSSSKDNYDNQRTSAKIQKVKAFTFKAEVKNARKEQMLLMEKNPAKYMVPHLVNFLDALKKKRVKDANENLKKNLRNNQFIDKVKKHVDDEIAEPKKDFLKALQKKADYNSKTPELLSNLFQLFRKNFIKKAGEALVPVSKRHRLIYLVRVTWMNREMVNKRKGIEILRKWRFNALMKKIAKQKLEAMYKNMHLNYLNMAREVFGEDETNPGMIQHFESFGNDLGLFTNVDLKEYEVGKKKYYKQVQKKFTFEPVEMNYDGEESHYDDNSMYNKYSIVGDNPEYYYDEGIGDATQGRYKVDTDVSGKNLPPKKK